MDNITLNAATVGGGGTIATDDVAGVQYQKVKLDFGADGATSPATAANPYPVLAAPLDFSVSQTNLLAGKAAYIYNILGRRSTFSGTTPFQDIATYLVGGQAALTAVSAATQYFIVSTSAQDAVGGTGMSGMRIIYLDGSGAQQVAAVTLTGTTKVNLGTGFSSIQWMESAIQGSATSAAAAGNVAIFSGAGAAAAEATTVEQILAGGNRSLSGRYRIPNGYKGYLLSWSASAPGSQTMDVRLRGDFLADDSALSLGIFHFKDTLFLPVSSGNSHAPLPYVRVPAGAMIKISCLPGATSGTPRVDANFELLIVAD